MIPYCVKNRKTESLYGVPGYTYLQLKLFLTKGKGLVSFSLIQFCVLCCHVKFGTLRTNWGAVCGLCGKAAGGGRGQGGTGERAALEGERGGSWRGRGGGTGRVFGMDSPHMIL